MKTTRSASKKKLPRSKSQVITASLPVYVTAVFTVALSISLIAFALFWRSPARDLAIEVQQAKEAILPNPFLNEAYTGGQDSDIQDGILQVGEIEGLLRQANDLATEADTAADFRLEDYQGFGRESEL